jgi:hypothetical protein
MLRTGDKKKKPRQLRKLFSARDGSRKLISWTRLIDLRFHSYRPASTPEKYSFFSWTTNFPIEAINFPT